MAPVSRPGRALTAGCRPSPPSTIRSPSRLSAPIAVHGDRAGPTLILASTRSSHASGAPPKPAACSHTHESACSVPQLWPAVPRHPDTLTLRPSASSMPVTCPSGTLASSLVRGSGERYSAAGSNGRNGGSSLAMARSQRAACSPIAACPPPEPSRPRGSAWRKVRENLLDHARRPPQVTIEDSAPQRHRFRPAAMAMPGMANPQCPAGGSVRRQGRMACHSRRLIR